LAESAVEAQNQTNFTIGVDVNRALEILGGNVFSGSAATVRELIANSADSIRMLPEHLKGIVEIRIRKRRT